MDRPNHELADFMQSVTEEIARDYDRIQKRVNEDPGTASDQGEEDWAKLLRNWLPPTYQVVTKGRILGSDGTGSPQVDVLVLDPTYPKYLLNQKLYLAGGVVAAFECKVTLEPQHITKAVENAAVITKLSRERTGTPYKELYSRIIYGLLAHSHTWRKPRSKPIDNIDKALEKADAVIVQHPREMLDVLCVANLASWTVSKTPWFGPENAWNWESEQQWFGPDGAAVTSFMCYTPTWLGQAPTYSPVGTTIAFLLRRLAWENQSIRELAYYFSKVGLSGMGAGFSRRWPIDIYSTAVRQELKTKAPEFGPPNYWNEWGSIE